MKVRPDRAPPVTPPPSLALEAFRGEGVAGQVVLRSDVAVAAVTPSLTPFAPAGGGTALPGNAAALYRVGFINVATRSDPAGATGEWPDALVPIGTDRFHGESRNGAPFALSQDSSQPVWIDVRVPRTALPGDYQATFTVTDGAGAVLGSLPVRLTVFAAELPFKSFLPTSYGFGMYPVFAWFHNGATSPQTDVDLLTADFIAEAAAHRITLDVTDAYVAGTPPNLNWSMWDQYQSPPGVTSHPVPVPPGLPAGVWNQQLLTTAQVNQAIATWAATAQHYTNQRSWLEGNYLYTKDEPQAAQYPINIQQAQTLRQADSRLHSLVTHAYDAGLAPGDFDIWVPNVRFIDAADAGVLEQQYLTLQASQKSVWWYDSNNSGFPDASGVYGNWPDEFIDHPGVNQLVHGPLTFKYRLDGYLYYSTFVAFQDLTRDPYANQFYFGRNGDGTLFYPGRPNIIGGTQGIPLPSIRLQLLRQSWSLYDALELARQRGFGTQARQIAGGLVSTATSWSKDPAQYDQARSQLAALLAPQPRLLFMLDRSTFSDTEVAQAGTTAVANACYVVLDGVLPAQIGMTMLPGTQAERDAVSPAIAFQRASGALPGVRAVPTAVASEGPFDPYAIQRLTFTYTVEFTGIAAFLENGQPVDRQDVTVTATLATAAPAAQATVTLIRQPNPYMLDGIMPWLSTDLRVFQIGPNHALPFPTAAAAPSDAASARSFIQTVLTELDGNAANFGMLPAGYEDSTLELARTHLGQPVFNFAVARVRHDGQATAAQDVRVFFRLFTTAATGLDYHADLNYRRSAAAGPAVALLGETAAGELTTIPCIAVQRIDTAVYGMDQQLVQRPDAPNTKTLPAGTGVQRFFGAWLDINQPSEPQFPATPAGDGPWTSGRQPIQNLIRNRHQCLVAEIYYVPTAGTGDPIPVGATPGSSENLSQRNLSIVESANPTTVDSRRVQTTFVVHQQANGASGEEEGPATPDELMVLWDALPAGATAELTFSGIDAGAVLTLARRRDGPDVLRPGADGALECTVGGVTYVPLPPAGEPVPGLLSVTLPAGVRRGERYEVLVRHVRGRTRRIVGSFALTIPVRPARELLAREESALAVLRHIESQLEPTDRWTPVFRAYVEQVARRVDAFGGAAEAIPASPDGAPVRRRWWRAWVLAALPPLGWLAWKWLRRDRRRRRRLRSLR